MRHFHAEIVVAATDTLGGAHQRPDGRGQLLSTAPHRAAARAAARRRPRSPRRAGSARTAPARRPAARRSRLRPGLRRAGASTPAPVGARRRVTCVGASARAASIIAAAKPASRAPGWPRGIVVAAKQTSASTIVLRRDATSSSTTKPIVRLPTGSSNSVSAMRQDEEQPPLHQAVAGGRALAGWPSPAETGRRRSRRRCGCRPAGSAPGGPARR